MSVKEDVTRGAGSHEDWVDPLRVTLIAGVIVVHTATGYVADFAGWYYDDELDPSGPWSIGFTLPALLGGLFGLGPLFVVAGFFSVGSLSRRGPGAFVRRRMLRLGVPLLLYVLLVNPVADLVGNVWQEDDSFWDYLASTELSVMWFVAALLACSLGYAALRIVVPASRPAAGPPGARPLALASGLIALVGLAVWQVSSITDAHLLNLKLGEWPQAIVLFALGVHAGEAGWWLRLPDRQVRRLGWTAAAGLLGVAVLMFVEGARDRVDEALSGVGVASVLFAVLYGAVSVSWSLWCVSWAARHWSRPGRLVRAAGRASYATYFIHPLALTLVMLAWAPVPLGPALKFVVVATVAVPVCFLVGHGMTRAPGLRAVF